MATESGPTQPLTLNTTITMTLDTGDVRKPLAARIHYVAVSSNPVGWAQHHWEWLMGSIILPAAGYGCKRWLDRSKQPPASDA